MVLGTLISNEIYWSYLVINTLGWVTGRGSTANILNVLEYCSRTTKTLEIHYPRLGCNLRILSQKLVRSKPIVG